jgi:hypothetical protein
MSIAMTVLATASVMFVMDIASAGNLRQGT